MFELLHSASIINRDRSVGDSPTLILCRCKGGASRPPSFSYESTMKQKYRSEARLTRVVKLMI